MVAPLEHTAAAGAGVDLGQGVTLHQAECVQRMAELADAGVRVHAIITDPPYHLEHMSKRFRNGTPVQAGGDGAFERRSQGWLNHDWDGGTVAFDAETWRVALDLLHPGGHLIAFSSDQNYDRLVSAAADAGFERRRMVAWLHGQGMSTARQIRGGRYDGAAPDLKPAIEPACVMRKPIDRRNGSVARQLGDTGTGALNIRESRVGTTGGTTVRGVPGTYRKQECGRYPSGVCHDGGDDVMGELGHAAAFYYCAKPGPSERSDTAHPTVKPLRLMRWLVRMVTFPGQTILDPFAGSGTTGMAAILEGRNAILIEQHSNYCDDIQSRIYRAQQDAAAEAGKGTHNG